MLAEAVAGAGAAELALLVWAAGAEVAQAPNPKADKVIPAREPFFKKLRLFISVEFVEIYSKTR